jgi:FtsH-binding integral membrane protein
MINDQDYTYANVVASATAVEQKEFYKQTYMHLALALLSTILIEYAFLASNAGESITYFVMDSPIISFLLFMGASWIGQSLAYSQDKSRQYLGLGLYVTAYSVFFVPVIYLTTQYLGIQIIQEAAIITSALFAGLTFVAFTTKKDFTFLEGALKIGAFIMIGVMIASIFSPSLTSSIFWIGFVILFLGGLILYETSQIKYKYPTNMYVGAAATLYGSFMTLFLYVLRLLMALRE